MKTKVIRVFLTIDVKMLDMYQAENPGQFIYDSLADVVDRELCNLAGILTDSYSTGMLKLDHTEVVKKMR